MARLITRAWDRARPWCERLLAILAYHQANIQAAAASHTRKRKERLRAAGVAPEVFEKVGDKVAL